MAHVYPHVKSGGAIISPCHDEPCVICSATPCPHPALCQTDRDEAEAAELEQVEEELRAEAHALEVFQ